jgi:glycosyltransferase involved in cell wall biosynthesis
MGTDEIEISVVVPVKDEADSVSVLAREIEIVMRSRRRSWECLWIDDGSTDGTLLALRAITRSGGPHRYVSLDRNYGQSAALAQGWLEARGRIVVTLDADLQNDPADIPKLIEPLDRGEADMVNGYRQGRQDDAIRRISSRLANGFRNRLTGERVRDVGCSLRAFRRETVLGVPVFRGMHRFLPTLARLNGARLCEVPVAHRARRFGQTKYGIGNRLWVGLADTLAVRWWQQRSVRPKVRWRSADEGAAGPGGSAGEATRVGEETTR